MANKAISELPQALNVNNQDLFVLEQSGIAKKLTAETFITEQGIIDALAVALDGHGGIQSVTLSSVSGRVRTYLITFSDASATTFQVYDGTTITGIQKTSTAGLVDTYTVYMSDGTTSFFQVRNGQDGSATWNQINSKAPIITDTVTGAIVNFPDGADDIPVADLVVNIEPKQSGSGDPSPSNIRPISGWTGCNVTRTGKNIADKNIFDINKPSWSTAQYWLGLSENADGTYTLTRPIGWGGHGMVYIGTYPAGTYTVSFDLKSTASVTCGAMIKAFNTKTWVVNAQTDKSGMSTTGRQSMATITTTAICDFWLAVGPYTNNGAQVISGDYQVEVGKTATAYESYQDSSVTVDWSTEAGTVYGGTVDVATGLLTVTDGYIASYNGETLPSTWISDRDVYASGTTPTTGAEVVYKLATPQTYQLTGQQLMTLLGTNNVWADIGNVSVTYPADTKMFIEKLTMPTEDDMVANQTITSGKYFMIGNSLYLALANIASGAQITIGTNAQRVSLADALNTINS